jgi:DNA-binding MarR family transcriptional regulator
MTSKALSVSRMDSYSRWGSMTTFSLLTQGGSQPGGSAESRRSNYLAGYRDNCPVAHSTPSEVLPPSAGADADELVDAVLAASRALVAVAARSLAAAAEEVTLPQYRALVVLAADGPKGTADLAAALAVDPSTVTRVCDRLVRKGLVRRHRQPGDRRTVRIALTGAGRDLVAEVTRRRRVELARLLGALPPDQHQPVIAAFRAFAAAAGETPPPGTAFGWAGP